MKTERGPQPSTSNSVGTAALVSGARLSSDSSSARVTFQAVVTVGVTSTGRSPVALADQEMAGAVGADELDLRRVGRRQGLVEGSARPRRHHALAFAAFVLVLARSCSGRSLR